MDIGKDTAFVILDQNVEYDRQRGEDVLKVSNAQHVQGGESMLKLLLEDRTVGRGARAKKVRNDQFDRVLDRLGFVRKEEVDGLQALEKFNSFLLTSDHGYSRTERIELTGSMKKVDISWGMNGKVKLWQEIDLESIKAVNPELHKRLKKAKADAAKKERAAAKKKKEAAAKRKERALAKARKLLEEEGEV